MENDKQNGHGKLTKKNGDIYEGNFKNGTFDGEVIVHFADGSKFKGIYVDGKRNGKAVEVDRDGRRFEGSYKDDLRDGKFIEKDRNGNIVSQGMYILGNRVQ